MDGVCGTEAPDQPSLHCDTAALAFGNVIQQWDEFALNVVCTNDGGVTFPVTRQLDGPFGLLDEDPVEPVSLPPGAILRSSVTIDTGMVGSASGELRPVGPGGVVLASIALTGNIVPEPFAIQPAAIDFGLVAPGTELRRTVRLRNFTREPLHVQHPGFSNVFQLGSGVDFTVPPDVPSTVEDEGFLEIDVVFAPQFEGPVLETFWFQPASGSDAQLRLEGRGGAPELRCDPEVLDLGATAVGVPISAVVTCTNVGLDDPTSTRDNVRITSLDTGDAAWSASLRGAVPTDGFAPGDAFEIEVVFAPTTAGTSHTRLSIDAGTTGIPEILLAGEALDLPSCDPSIAPAQRLDFGAIAPGAQAMLQVVITNPEPHPCLLRSFGLTGATDVFQAVRYEEELLEPGGTLQIPVYFSADAPADYRADLRFVVSNPQAPVRSVELVGVVRDGCLVPPRPQETFRSVVPGCTSLERPIWLENVCTAAVEVTAVSVVDPRDAFSWTRPTTPQSIAPGARLEIPVRYEPPAVGSDFAAILVRTDESPVPYLAAVSGWGVDDPAQSDTWSWERQGRIFVLHTHPGDRTGDGQVTAADLEVRVNDNLASDWTWDGAQRAVVFGDTFDPMPGSQIDVFYDAACL